MSVGVCDSKGVSMLGGGIDPSNLHLKKELTQIRKAARVLRDPGTSSLGSSRSLTKHHYVHHQKNGHTCSSDHLLKVESSNSFSKGDAGSDKGNPNGKEKGRSVFLYNWRNQKSEGERSRQIGKDDDVENGKDEGSFSTREESLDLENSTNVRNVGGNDSKSDGYLSDMYSSAMLKRLGSNFRPTSSRRIKKKSKSSYSSGGSRRYREKLRLKTLLSKYTKGGGLGKDELLSYVQQSDDTEEVCYSEDLTTDSALSPLLVRLMNKGLRRKEEDSISCSTQALSTSSCNRYAIRNPSSVESWDATTGSLNDADDEVDDQLDFSGRQGCGIPCYWSKRSTPKSRYGSSCSPSLSGSLRRKGSTMFRGSQSMSQRRHHSLSLGSYQRKLSSKTTAQSLIPLLGNDRGGLSMRSGNSDDELSTNFSELDLEALSRLDGRRWSSSCRSQEGLDLVALHEECSPENMRSLSNKYRPMFFEELIGQNIVVQSLKSAISRGRITPVYLFQGPRGNGKTSTARIFAAALNCLSTKEIKPCGVCGECIDLVGGKSRYLEEVDCSNKKGLYQLKSLLKKILVVQPFELPHYKVFVINQCHLLPSKTWLAFLRLLDKQLRQTVFILITTDIDNVPRAVLARCQKHHFNKLSNGDIVARLRKICIDERLDFESSALELIASNAYNSLGDAETMLDQLSLFGKRITKSLVNELIGVVSDEKLLDLLELAMSSNATETIIRARELMDSGADPIALISQFVTLIVDIIAGNYTKHNDSSFGGRTLTERELDRLKHALVLLSEAEKHLRVSSERSTWFTATLLQLCSLSSPDRSRSLSSRRQSSKATEEDHMSVREIFNEKLGSPTSNSMSKENQAALIPKSDQGQFIDGKELNFSCDGTATLSCKDSKMLNDIWLQCIEKCHSKMLRQLLLSYGKLVSISEMKGGIVAHIAFYDSNIKTRAEGFLSSITNSFEVVLQCNAEVKVILLHDFLGDKLMEESSMNPENKSTRSNKSRGYSSEFIESVAGNANGSTSQDSKSGVPLRRIESIIHEQRLETAWLQATEKGTPRSISHLKPERNQVLPQDHPNEMEPICSLEDELNLEVKVVKTTDGIAHQKDQIVKKIDRCPISPSLMHSKDNMYESGSGAGGCSGMFCWNNRRAQRRAEGTQGSSTRARVPKGGRFSLFGDCAKSRSRR
ncbi:hypothetical protein ACS0TY_005417 [Phlomoides rotata]